MNTSHFTITLRIPRTLEWTEGGHRRTFDRESFLGFLWERFSADTVGENALLGVHEGTMLSDEAFTQGFETESFTLDSGEAPRERDWIGSQGTESAVLYFGSRSAAASARAILIAGAPALAAEEGIGDVEEEEPRDWDAEWKASFQGVSVPPNWEIRPPWVSTEELGSGKRLLRLNPGAGFGTGTHETTQLCLELLAEWMNSRGRKSLDGSTVLDFGSGSGILAIGAALLGARADGVEIDELAIENAKENARLNEAESLLRWGRTFDRVEGSDGKVSPTLSEYDLVFANILKPVLLEFAPTLVSRVKRGGALILSGLVEHDLEAIIPRFQPLFGHAPTRVVGKNEWRALLWSDKP